LWWVKNTKNKTKNNPKPKEKQPKNKRKTESLKPPKKRAGNSQKVA